MNREEESLEQFENELSEFYKVGIELKLYKIYGKLLIVENLLKENKKEQERDDSNT